MNGTIIICVFALAQQDAAGPKTPTPPTWADYYQNTAKRYEVLPAGEGRTVQFSDPAVFSWTSINEFHGGVFAWTEKGRPVMVATIFSFPRDNGQRLVLHEFASFAEGKVDIVSPDGARWTPPPLQHLQRVPDAAQPPSSPNLLKLHCRRLAHEFSAHMYRREERWDLRLLPTPLIEYQASDDVLGGGLFAFVGYSTDPEILLLLEARTSRNGPEWLFQAVRFSDKSLHLKFKEKIVWESVRSGHGGGGVDTADPHYRVLGSERLSPEFAEKLSSEAARE